MKPLETRNLFLGTVFVAEHEQRYLTHQGRDRKGERALRACSEDYGERSASHHTRMVDFQN